MPILFNALLEAAGADPAKVRLLRHQDQRATQGRSPYRLWRDSRSAFEDYQSHQRTANRQRFAGRHWASFVGALEGQTLFVELYTVLECRPNDAEWAAPHSGEVSAPGTDDIYMLELAEGLAEFAGVLYVDWGRASAPGCSEQITRTSAAWNYDEI